MGIGDGVNPGTYYASISMSSATRAVLHLMSPQPCIHIIPTTFCEILKSYGNPSLWENLSYDGNGEWIREGLVAGSICIAHDGLYMPKESMTLSSAGIIVYCKNTKQWLRVLVTERSNAASNYRGELLGAVLALLILRAATSTMTTPYPQTTLQCNNKGVIGHSNSPLRSLPEKQQQADMIRLVKHLASTNKCRAVWEWVEGHAVKSKGWEYCSLPEQLNHQADLLAKAALVSGLEGGLIMEGDFPFEPVRLKLSGNRGSGSP
jgi:hypothetical protein